MFPYVKQFCLVYGLRRFAGKKVWLAWIMILRMGWKLSNFVVV